MEKRHRIFVAINLPEDIKKQLFSYSEKWPEFQAKWTAEDNLHITLEFLGDLTDQEIGDVCCVVKEVAERHECFDLSVNKILYGPPEKIPPHMIWVEGERSKELSALRGDLEKSLTGRVAFIPENRVFAPHITLARIGAWAWRQINPEERPEVNEILDLVFTVESIEVMESILKRRGPQYTILESHSLS